MRDVSAVKLRLDDRDYTPDLNLAGLYEQVGCVAVWAAFLAMKKELAGNHVNQRI